MRPVRLEMQGFSAFADRTEIDFDGRRAGRARRARRAPARAASSTPSRSRSTARSRATTSEPSRRSINQLCSEARVRLDFERRRHRLHRGARRPPHQGRGATTREARLEAGGEVLAGDAKSLTERGPGAARAGLRTVQQDRGAAAGSVRGVPARQAGRSRRRCCASCSASGSTRASAQRRAMQRSRATSRRTCSTGPWSPPPRT